MGKADDSALVLVMNGLAPSKQQAITWTIDHHEAFLALNELKCQNYPWLYDSFITSKTKNN